MFDKIVTSGREALCNVIIAMKYRSLSDAVHFIRILPVNSYDFSAIMRLFWNTWIIAQHFSNENRRFFYKGFPQMNVDNVDNVESTWRIKLCATAKNGEISYIIAKNMKNRQNIM